MVVVALEPMMRFMDRCGMGTSTRKVAARLWPDGLPDSDPEDLVRALYAAENKGKAEPSGSQDMIGMLYPGINRLDYDFDHEGGVFPVHIETHTDAETARWLERVIHMVPIAQRPAGYNPLGVKHLDPQWIERLGRSGKDCFDAIVARDAAELGRTMNTCMLCWEAILPDVVHHHTLTVDLMAIWHWYRTLYPGAMYSGCGGGYLYVVSEEPVPGGFSVRVRDGAQRVRF
jgi:hypothetical protein